MIIKSIHTLYLTLFTLVHPYLSLFIKNPFEAIVKKKNNSYNSIRRTPSVKDMVTNFGEYNYY